MRHRSYGDDRNRTFCCFPSSEQPPPEAMMQLHKIADVELGWLAIVYSMLSKITTSDPLGPAVITLILDECPLPSKVCKAIYDTACIHPC